MGATLTTFDKILKDHYIGPVVEQLNNSVDVLKLFKKKTVKWNGRRALIPIHTGRNDGVVFAKDGVLPTAGNQTFKELEIRSKNLYGRFKVDGEAMDTAIEGGPAAFESWSDAEIKRLVTDIKVAADRVLVSGGLCVGFLNEHKTATTSTAGNYTNWEFSGDFDKLDACIAAKGSDVHLTLVSMERIGTKAYENVFGAGSTLQVACKSVDKQAGTIELEDKDTTDASQLTTAGVATGYGIAVIISDTDPVLDSSAGGIRLDSQPTGIYGNLGLQEHFGLARNASASDPVDAIRAHILTMSTATTHARAALDTTRMQEVFDVIADEMDVEPNVILINHRQRSKYVDLLQGTFLSDAKDGAKKGSAGFTGFDYANVDIKSARHIDNGLMLFLHTDEWGFYEKTKGKFEDRDGNILDRISGEDAFEGYFKWRYETACTKPQANGAIVGLTL